MRWFASVYITAGLAMAGAVSAAQPLPPGCASLSESDLIALHTRWAASLETRHPDRVLKNYAPDATLIGLDGGDMRSGQLDIRDHYVYFLQREPSAKAEDRSLRIGCNAASDSGVQTMSLRPKAKVPAETVKVRYSLMYELRGDAWMIVHHHLSIVPTKPAAAPAVAGFIKRAPVPRRTAPSAASPASDEASRRPDWIGSIFDTPGH